MAVCAENQPVSPEVEAGAAMVIPWSEVCPRARAGVCTRLGKQLVAFRINARIRRSRAGGDSVGREGRFLFQCHVLWMQPLLLLPEI